MKLLFKTITTYLRSNPGCETLVEHVDLDPEVRGGQPCLVGTRVTVAQILAEVAEGRSLDELSDDLGLDRERLRGLFDGASEALVALF